MTTSTETRTILVHLTVDVSGEDSRDVDDIATVIAACIDVGLEGAEDELAGGIQRVFVSLAKEVLG